MFSFKILHQEKNSHARVGTITTSHGEISTPSFVPVGTLASVKSLTPDELINSKAQVILCNTYHLYLRPGADEIKTLGGLHKFMNWKGPMITDSGGFQVFSLGLKNSKFGSNREKLMTKISDENVIFKSHIDGSIHEFTPEKSINIQEKLGSDIMIAFDHCPPHPSSHGYVDQAVERTFLWARRCLKARSTKKQALYGVVQGGIYKDLREKSTRQIISLPFDGFAIGGVAVGEGKKEMYDAVSWTTPALPEEKPRHLLGVGEIDDFFQCVSQGIDTFDCVIPTRLGRMGKLFVKDKQEMGVKPWQMDITKHKYSLDKSPIEKNCQCYTCRNFTRGYINHLFRNEELLSSRLATIHNIFFLSELLSEIRNAILNNQFEKLMKKWLYN